MREYQAQLDWIASQAEHMLETLITWSNINSGSENAGGVTEMCGQLESVLSPLSSHSQRISLPPREIINCQGDSVTIAVGQGLHCTKRRKAPYQVFLGGHLDTVFPKESLFQKAEPKGSILHGPGVADLKGGLVVLCTALSALERSPFASNLGWEVFLNPDEEVGSTSSADFLLDCGKRNDIGLIVEPALEDGTLVSARKGSANYSIVIRGRSAHAGRAFQEGRNALYALAHVVTSLEELIQLESGRTVNVGQIEGGSAVNIVPDLGICRFNIRMSADENVPELERRLQKITADCNAKDGLSCTLHGHITRPAKAFDIPTQNLFEAVRGCGESLGQTLKWKATGGVCDGNILASAGLPTIDTLGVRGGLIHTHDEFMCIDSLVERAQLMALLLMRLAAGEIKLEKGKRT